MVAMHTLIIESGDFLILSCHTVTPQPLIQITVTVTSAANNEIGGEINTNEDVEIELSAKPS